MTTWCKEQTPWKRPWCWERLKAGGEGDNRGWNGWMTSTTQWTWLCASPGWWWRTGKLGMLQLLGLRRVGHDWVTGRQEEHWLEFPGLYSVGVWSVGGSGRSPGEGNGNPLQYSCIRNPMDRGTWRGTVHEAAKNQALLSDWTLTHTKAFKILHSTSKESSSARKLPGRNQSPYLHCSTAQFLSLGDH